MAIKAMTFGKYEGHTPRWIIENDPDYVDWLMYQDWFEEQHPHLYEVFDELWAEFENRHWHDD